MDLFVAFVFGFGIAVAIMIWLMIKDESMFKSNCIEGIKIDMDTRDRIGEGHFICKECGREIYIKDLGDLQDDNYQEFVIRPSGVICKHCVALEVDEASRRG